METKRVRETRKMRLITVAAAALLVMLGAYGIADGSTVTLSIVVDAPVVGGMYQLDNVGDTVTYTVYGLVDAPATNDGFGDPVYSILKGGLDTYIVDQFYTGTGQISNTSKTGPNAGKATTVIPAPFTTYGQNGFLVDVGGSKTGGFPGVGGVVSTGGGMSFPESFAYWESTAAKATYEIGNGSAAALFTGTIQAVANGTVDISVVMEKVGTVWQSNLWTTSSEGLLPVPVETVIPGSAVVHVGPPETTNVAPVIDSIVPSSVTEADWSREPGWDNLEHKVIAPIVATAHDDDAGDTLSYTWILESSAALPGGGQTLPVGENSAILNLSLQDLVNAGFVLPLYVGDNDPTYDWILTLTIDDGNGHSATSADIPVFVPEPATMGLLAFGVVALLRRRRRA